MSRASSWWGLSITRSVNTLLPAPWQHSWECRMFTCLETVYLTPNLNISLLHLVSYISIQYINLWLEQNFSAMCCFLLILSLLIWSLVEVVFECLMKLCFSDTNGTNWCHRGYCWLSEAIRCCKHPTESPRCPNPSFQSRMFTAPSGCQQWKSIWDQDSLFPRAYCNV